MKVLVTGGAGYIGSVLVKTLLQNGFSVICLDRFFFGKESLADVVSNPNLKLVADDIRFVDPKIFEGVDAVIDLAALSNDPAGELDPQKTMEINYQGRARIAKLAKENGVKRYILASSCSIYGFQDGVLDETAKPNPLTTYAKANLQAEQANLPLADKDFCVTALRFATVYGASGRMRFDLAVNGMVLSLFKTGKIKVMRDGTQWRPFVHVRDVCKAIIATLKAAKEKVSGQIINVGSDDQNYQIIELANLVGKTIGKYEIEWYGDADNRSYRVSFAKAKKLLKFSADFRPNDGAQEIFAGLKSGILTDTQKTRTVEWYKQLLTNKELASAVAIKGIVL